uniref:RING-type domain-containing protein n=1 Tax=Globisporangium ultimum (strain ATCC 200006 / CBS 805.95 / DAOM BR144) TaxID=431595 RepID=K3X158_GLOUD
MAAEAKKWPRHQELVVHEQQRCLASPPDGQSYHPDPHVLFASDALDLDVETGPEYEAMLSEVYALELYREELRIAEQCELDTAIAFSLNDLEERKIWNPTQGSADEDEGKVALHDQVEEKPAPSCACCLMKLDDASTRRMLPCGHLYCRKCVATRSSMGVRDRSLLPAHCCRKEFPIDYVKEVLPHADFALYERFIKEKHWKTLDLDSDREYARVVKSNGCVQCPGCGIGVSKIVGCNHMKCCNGHEFCYACGKVWKTCPCAYP